MTTPPPYYGEQTPAAGNDKVTLWGVLGIVFALCCPLLGIVFAVLCLNEAKKFNKPNTLAIVAFALAGLNIVLNGILAATGAYSGYMGSN